jgi:hypothetical protein
VSIEKYQILNYFLTHRGRFRTDLKSIPSNSIANSTLDIIRLLVSELNISDEPNRPRSNRRQNRLYPPRCHHNIFTRFLGRLKKTNKCPDSESASMIDSTKIDNPLYDFLMSVGVVATNTLTVSGIISMQDPPLYRSPHGALGC